MTVTQKHLNEQRAFYALMDEARKLGIPTSCDDPRSPRTVEAIRVAVETMR